MAVAALELLRPADALLALAVVVPLAMLALGLRRSGRVRRSLGLGPAALGGAAAVVVALVLTAGLLGLAAARPVISSTGQERVRTDAQVMVVVDTSRSMLAASSARSRTRFDRARAAAIALRASLPGVPVGVASFTDRVLPDLFPSGDEAAFGAVVRRTLGVEQPPPQQSWVEATSFDALSLVPTQNYFTPSARRRVVVVLTDGESRPFSADAVGSAFRHRPATRLVVVRFWSARDRLYGPGGRLDPGYRPDPSSAGSVDTLATATGGQAFDEGQLGAAGQALRADVGQGPTGALTTVSSTRDLTSLVLLAALVPLAFVLWQRNLGPLTGRKHRPYTRPRGSG
jgi:hypothetical protein